MFLQDNHKARLSLHERLFILGGGRPLTHNRRRQKADDDDDDDGCLGIAAVGLLLLEHQSINIIPLFLSHSSPSAVYVHTHTQTHTMCVQLMQLLKPFVCLRSLSPTAARSELSASFYT